MLCCDLDQSRIAYSVYFQFAELGFVEQEASCIIWEANIAGQKPQGWVSDTFDTSSLAVVVTLGKCHNPDYPQFSHLQCGHNNACLICSIYSV